MPSTGRPSKSILFQQKNKVNVYSNLLFSADFVNTSLFVNIEQNLDWARADCLCSCLEFSKTGQKNPYTNH